MKTKRILIIAALTVAALILPALAATFNLGNFTVVNNETQKGWASNGTDDKETDLSIETLKSAKTLVLEFSKAPEGGMQLIWQGDGDGWAWNQTDGVIPNEGMEEKTIRIDLAKTLKNYAKLKESTKAKLLLGYYSDNIADLGITRAYLDGVSAAGSAKTGDGPGVKTAAAALVLSVCAAALLARKVKAR